MVGEIDRFPVKDLPNRYGINRSVLYTRLEKLNIKTTKEGNKSYVDNESLKLLDALDSYLKNGGTTNEFLNQTDNKTNKPDTMAEPLAKGSLTDQTDIQDRQDRQPEQLTIQGLFDQLINTAVEASKNTRSELNDLRDLEEIANNKWLVPTKRLAEIIGRSRSYFTGKKTINYCGFVFSKVDKQGNESLWRITKQN